MTWVLWPVLFNIRVNYRSGQCVKLVDDSKLGDATNTTENQAVIVEVKGLHEQNCH